ncbi:PKD domain-containing protein [Halorussus pelagicus]|uniref:PKD domain-containing protein n=1 Tax=Halorussus pelagicus TaxID=2505977 RepID=UPI000FFBFE54|nr:PKD domain-containing protein [Halorussus pelagicus]
MVDHSEVRTESRAMLETETADTTTESTDAERDDEPSIDYRGATVKYAPGAPVAGNPVLFETDHAPDHPETEFEWRFGDGATATGKKASNVYDAGGRTEVTLTVTDGEGATETATETVTVYHEVETTLGASEDDLVSVVLRSDEEFAPTESVSVTSLRFGAPTAVAMGSGASPVRTETDGDDLRVWVRPDRAGLDDTETVRVAGRTTDGVPLAGTVDVR